MASPDLYRGICCICFGMLLPDNTLHQDLGEGRGGVHKGVCAIDAGIYPPEHAARFEKLIADYHAANAEQYRSPEAVALLKRHWELAHEVAECHNIDEVEQRFQGLKEQWTNDTEVLSNLSEIVEHPAYQKIIAMGWDAVFCMIRDLDENGPDHWFPALAQIVGEDVAAGETTMYGATRKWLDWWDRRQWLTTQKETK